MNNSIAIRKTLTEYGLLSIGTFLIALAVKQYMIPCRIITGSVSGLALLFHEIIGLDDSLLVLVLNRKGNQKIGDRIADAADHDEAHPG